MRRHCDCIILPISEISRKFVRMILIIDGDDAAAARLEKVLRYRGLESHSVGDGLEALSLLQLRKPQLIILELNLGPLDGLTLLAAIRTDNEFASVPIVVFSEVFAEEKIRKALSLGAREYIVKGTIGWDALLQRIQHYLPPDGGGAL